MSIIGSSSLPSTDIISFREGLTGFTGNQGACGPAGATGNSIIGPTGAIGATLVNITIAEDKTLVFHYSDNTTISSDARIIGSDGYSIIKLLGVSLASFSPLANSLVEQTYQTNYPIDILTFKGLSAATAPYLRINYINNNTINISYDLINVGYIGISGGTLGNILVNLPGQNQAGLTSTNYDEDQGSILIQHKNIQESLVICKPYTVGSSLAYWKIDPSQGTVFILNPLSSTLSTTSEINGYVIFIKRPQYGTLSKGLTIQFPATFTLGTNKLYYVIYDNDSDIDSGITFGENFYQRFDVSGIEWQNNSYFCPDASYNALNLISLSGRYLAIPSQYEQNNPLSNQKITSASLDTTCIPYERDEITEQFFAGGLCCPASCSASSYESISGGCTGYFIPTKRLSNSSLCSRKGSCCIKTSDGVFNKTENTYCQCSAAAGENEFVFHPYEGLKTSLEWFNCDFNCFGPNVFGGCCDGVGNCDQQSKNTCLSLNYFFQGIGVKCNIDSLPNVNICSGGSGGCCDSGVTCVNGYTGSTCISENKSYLGDQQYCQNFTCSPDSIACSQTIPGISDLKQGDEYAGGIVVGIFDTNTSKLYGNQSFAEIPVITGALGILEYNENRSNSANYTIRYDYHGYGFDKPFASRVSKNDKFILIVAKEDIEYENTKEFIWSKGQTGWGNLHSPITLLKDEIVATSIFSRGEGIVADSSPSLGTKTFSPSSIRVSGDSLQWLASQPTDGYNGNWRRNYGLYNTHRLITSKLIYSEGSFSDYTAYDAIVDFNIQNPPTSNIESSWFIPSHDEMAFLSYYTRETNDFNINVSLLLSGYSQMNGKYWTSTGAYGIEIGTLNGTKGTMAWIHNIDAESPDSNYSIIEHRTNNKYKVRPIKLIRCDGSFPMPTDETYKLWRLPLIT